MGLKTYDISFPKMDYLRISLAIKKNEQNTKLSDSDLIYFTVRDKVYSEKIIFQKTLEDGITYNETTGKYEITIESIDTQKMDMEKKYGYDITIYFDKNKPKQQIVGNFTLSRKYTLNEVI